MTMLIVKRNNRLAGLRAKRFGKSFEDLFFYTCLSKSIACTRVPDGCKRVGGNRLVQIKTPWDWVLSFNGKAALIDTKSRDSAAFPLSAVELHQVNEMVKHANQGVLAGYVVWLRKVDQVIFIPAKTLSDKGKTSGSITPLTPSVKLLGPSNSFDPKLIFEVVSGA